MRRAILPALIAALVIIPFAPKIYVGLLLIALIIALIVWTWFRYREPPIDEAALQVELSEYVCFLNGEKL